MHTSFPFEQVMRQLSLAATATHDGDHPGARHRTDTPRHAGAAPTLQALLSGAPRHGGALVDGRRKILLVDDHDLMRLGIKALIGDADTIDWLEASTLADAMQACDEHPEIALVLLDLNLSDCKGLQGLAQLLARHPQARVIILSGTQDEFVVRQAKAMGAVGYLHKAAAPTATRDVLLAMLQSPSVDMPARPATHFPKFASASSYDRVAELGARHLEILELVLSGCTNQEISNATRLSLGTVKNYVSTILLALDVKSRSHLISLFR
jgi:DNA-binding NarL/FixJ family response regulator